MRLDSMKQGMESLWDSVADGWRHLRQSATSALTRFSPTADSRMPAQSEVDDAVYLPMRGWSMLGGDVFEDDNRIMVRLELPGMDKQDIDLQVEDDVLVVRGEKRFERESTEGRWRVLQCAYGGFRRVVPLPVAVNADAAQATYKNGVLRVELPKLTPTQRRSATSIGVQ